jgi:hypothetical protein
MKKAVFLFLFIFAVFSTAIYAHGGEEHEKPEKVSSTTMVEDAADSMHTESMEAMHDEMHDEVLEQTTERDFSTIRSEVQKSTTFIVIKALALAVAITGLAAVYLTRGKREES